MGLLDITILVPLTALGVSFANRIALLTLKSLSDSTLFRCHFGYSLVILEVLLVPI